MIKLHLIDGGVELFHFDSIKKVRKIKGIEGIEIITSFGDSFFVKESKEQIKIKIKQEFDKFQLDLFEEI